MYIRIDCGFHCVTFVVYDIFLYSKLVSIILESLWQDKEEVVGGVVDKEVRGSYVSIVITTNHVIPCVGYDRGRGQNKGKECTNKSNDHYYIITVGGDYGGYH